MSYLHRKSRLTLTRAKNIQILRKDNPWKHRKYPLYHKFCLQVEFVVQFHILEQYFCSYVVTLLVDFELVCSSGNSYNYNIICGSLANSSPVCVFASEARLPGQPQFLVNSHTFILDSKRERNDYIKVTYLWDNDYEVSWEEYNRLDPWRFEMPDDYDPIENNEVFHEHNISISTSIDFAMNWGFDGNSDNVYYIASYRTYPNSDEYGSYPGTYTEYQPYWTYSSFAFTVIVRLIYNFHEL